MRVLFIITGLFLVQFVPLDAVSGDRIDSLRIVLDKTKDAGKQMDLMYQLSLQYSQNGDMVNALKAATELLHLAEKHRHQKNIGLAQRELGAIYSRETNLPKALSHSLKALQIFEELNDTVMMTSALWDVSAVYGDMDDFPTANHYGKRACEHAAKNGDWFSHSLYSGGIGYNYIMARQPDSAMVCFQDARQSANRSPYFKNELIANALSGTGWAHELTGRYDLAKSHCRESFQYHEAIGNGNFLFVKMVNYRGLCNVFKYLNEMDSAVYYGRMAVASARQWGFPRQLQMMYHDMAGLYATVDKDSSIYYYQLEHTLRDSLFSAKNKTDIQNITTAEAERVAEQLTREQAAAEERKLMLEYVAVGAVILLLVILFLLLSHSFIVNERLVRFLGVVVMLVFFEFINLLIHPVVGAITHHSPALMVLALAAVASLIIPLHHKLEHWMLARVIEKNRRIRLAVAQRIIEQSALKVDADKDSPVSEKVH